VIAVVRFVVIEKHKRSIMPADDNWNDLPESVREGLRTAKEYHRDEFVTGPLFQPVSRWRRFKAKWADRIRTV
jgi:hypothetical protein